MGPQTRVRRPEAVGAPSRWRPAPPSGWSLRPAGRWLLAARGAGPGARDPGPSVQSSTPGARAGPLWDVGGRAGTLCGAHGCSARREGSGWRRAGGGFGADACEPSEKPELPSSGQREVPCSGHVSSPSSFLKATSRVLRLRPVGVRSRSRVSRGIGRASVVKRGESCPSWLAGSPGGRAGEGVAGRAGAPVAALFRVAEGQL